jgi:hypothetical protein
MPAQASRIAAPEAPRPGPALGRRRLVIGAGAAVAVVAFPAMPPAATPCRA